MINSKSDRVPFEQTRRTLRIRANALVVCSLSIPLLIFQSCQLKNDFSVPSISIQEKRKWLCARISGTNPLLSTPAAAVKGNEQGHFEPLESRYKPQIILSDKLIKRACRVEKREESLFTDCPTPFLFQITTLMTVSTKRGTRT